MGTVEGIVSPGKQAGKPARARGSMPFIMPDGRPLSALLHDNNLILSHRDRSHRSGKRGAKEPKQGWSTSTTSGVSATKTSGQMSEAEKAEYAALAKVGQRRQRRFLNEKLLRDMSGVLTAKDMESLFKPVPFGDSGHMSAFSLAATPEIAPLWDLFRSVDSDRQERVLKKWAEHVKELRQEAASHDDQGEGVAVDPATAALCSWAAVGSKARKALQKAPRACIEEIEKPIVDFLEQAQPSDQVELDLNDSFLRLLGHALADFHACHSFTRVQADGTKALVIRTRAPAPAQGITIACADILALLEEKPDEAISAAALRHVYHLHTNGSASDQMMTHNVPPSVVAVS